jgi:hypothetical protein
MINTDTLDDILGDIDDNEFSRALDTIRANVNDLGADDIRSIMDAARIADPINPGFSATVTDILNG